MPDLHPVARAGFGSVGERYESGRPGYPQSAVDWMVERLDIGPGSIVVDVGAGTGKLTRMLEATGCSLHAVEPIHAMSTVLRRHSPAVPVLETTAGSLPFGDGAVDTITAAQALHWFDTEATWTEFARVLRGGGGVGLIWNARDRSVPWVDRVWSIMDQVEKKAPWRDHGRPAGGFNLGSAQSAFHVSEMTEFHHLVPVTRASMLDRVASVSHVAVLPERDRRRVLDAVAEVLPDESELTVRYRVDVYALQRT